MHSSMRSVGVSASAVLFLAACSGKGEPPPQTAPEVSVAVVTAGPAQVIDILPGRVAPLRLAEVRARVAGIVLRRSFQEGAEIRRGEVLYVIDPASFRANVQGAEAALQKALANRRQTSTRAERIKTLSKTGAVSTQDAETAASADDQAAAEIAQARAALARSQLELDYATVRAPISGKIGRAMVTEGALVGQDEATLLAVLQQIDTVYVDVKRSAAQLDELRRTSPGGTTAATLLLDNGPYPQAGRLLFTDISVEPGTGEVTLRAQFPNPERRLLPGMFVRVRLERRIDQALTVPQQAVIRDGAGAAQVAVVDPKGKVSLRTVQTAGVDRGRYIVSAGLKSGERVVVEGQQKAQPGGAVKAVPWRPTQPATN